MNSPCPKTRFAVWTLLSVYTWSACHCRPVLFALQWVLREGENGAIDLVPRGVPSSNCSLQGTIPCAAASCNDNSGLRRQMDF